MINESRLVTCGGMYMSGSLCYIYADPKTGECVLSSDLLGNCVMGEITVMKPSTFEDEAVLKQMCETFDCDGAIMSDEYLVTLKDEKASYRPYANLMQVAKVIEYDIDTVYEDNDGEE